MENRILKQKIECVAFMLYKRSEICSVEELDEFCKSCLVFTVTPGEILTYCDDPDGYLSLQDHSVRVTQNFIKPLDNAFFRNFRNANSDAHVQPGIVNASPHGSQPDLSMPSVLQSLAAIGDVDSTLQELPMPSVAEMPPLISTDSQIRGETTVANVSKECGDKDLMPTRPLDIIVKPNTVLLATVSPALQESAPIPKELATQEPTQKSRAKKVVPRFEEFSVEAEVGSGGYGTVYKVQRITDGSVFAIKCPLEKTHTSCVQNEINMLKRLRGKEYIIQIEREVKGKISHKSDTGEEDTDCPSIVLEFVEHDKPEVLKKEITIDELRIYSKCLFRALAQLHEERILHLDVKPGNFLFSRSKKRGCLVDFNLARDESAKQPKRQKMTCSRGAEVRASEGRKSLKRQLVPKDTAETFVKISPRSMKMLSQTLTPVELEVARQLTSPPSKKRRLPDGKNCTPVEKSRHGKDVKLASPNMQQPSHDCLKLEVGRGGAGKVLETGQAEPRILHSPIVRHHETSKPVIKACINQPSHPSKSQDRQAETPNFVGKIRGHPGILRFMKENNIKQTSPPPLTTAAVQKKKVVSGKAKSKYPGFERSTVPKPKAASKPKRPCHPVKDGPCVGTKGYRAPEVLMRSLRQTTQVDIWSAGVSLLQLVTGKSPFPSTSTEGALKDIAKLRGSEKISKLASSLGRHHRSPKEPFAPIPVKEWCEKQSKRPDLKGTVPPALYDLIEKCLEVDPECRITAEQAIRHQFCTFD